MEHPKTSLLLVEDEALIAMAEKIELEHRDYAVACAGSGPLAVSMAKDPDARFDAILMDIDLGAGMDGTQAAQEILKGEDIPIVFVSSHTEPDVVSKTEKITSYGYVVKDSGIVVLDASIKMALKLFREKVERKQAERQVLRLQDLYAALSQINQAIVRAESLEALAADVCDAAVRFGRFKLAWVGRHDPRTSAVAPMGYAGEPPSIVFGMRHSSDEAAETPCFCGRALSEGRAFVLNTLSACEGKPGLGMEMEGAGIKAAAVLPIRAGGSAWGVFGVYAGAEGVFGPKEIALLEEAAMDIGYAVDKLEGEARRRRAEEYRRLSTEVLRVLNDPSPLRETSRAILRLIKEGAGLDAAGIRLKDRDDYPYFCEEGFPAEFVAAEDSLVERGGDGVVCKDEEGRVRLDCTCGLVISERCGPPSDRVTQAGSLWTNDSLATVEGLRGSDPRQNPRDRCVHEGYLSVALIPIRVEGRVVGLLHLGDRRKDRFAPEDIAFFEGLTASFGIAVARKRAEQGLIESERRFRLALAHAPVGVATQDLELRYTWGCNQPMPPGAGIVGKTDFELYPRQAEFLVALKRRSIESGRSARERLWVDGDGRRRFLELIVEPLRGEGGEVGSLGVVTLDLTEFGLARDGSLAGAAQP